MRLRQCATVSLCSSTRIWCSAWSTVSSCVPFWCLGRCRRYHEEGQKPPSPKGVNPRSRRTRLQPTSWAHVQRESRTVRPISLAFLGVQQTVGRQSTRATSRGSRGGRPSLAPSDARHHALLNASAARESTAAGSLKACLIKRQRC